MKAIALTCNHCGAPLSVEDDSVRFVTCRQCNTRLRIEHDDSTSFTKALDAIGEAAERIEAKAEQQREELETIKETSARELALARLDREWERQERDLRVRFGEESRLPTPSDRVTIRWMAAIMIPLFLIGSVYVCSLPHMGEVAAILIAGAVAMALAFVWRDAQLARSLRAQEAAKQRYEARRAEILGEHRGRETSRGAKSRRARARAVEPSVD